MLKLKVLKLSSFRRGKSRESDELLCVDTELPHTREEGCAVDAQPRGSSIGAAHASVTFGQCAHALLALFPRMLFKNRLPTVLKAGSADVIRFVFLNRTLHRLVWVRLLQFA